jgi:hypothetical protein
VTTPHPGAAAGGPGGAVGGVATPQPGAAGGGPGGAACAGGAGGAATAHPGAAAGGPAAAAVSGVPHAWQNWFPSGFWAPHLAHATAIYFLLGALGAASTRGRRARFTALGAAVSAMPQLGQKPDATMCMWQLGQTVSA